MSNFISIYIISIKKNYHLNDFIIRSIHKLHYYYYYYFSLFFFCFQVFSAVLLLQCMMC